MDHNMRRLIEFPCAGARLVGTLDEAPGKTGLLIVSGGNEIRIGAHRGMALLAASLAQAGIPVFRFDRRGIGDSSGTNLGWRESAPDIAAAAATFTAETGITRLIAFGNCDAATALALYHQAAGIDALILANPWTGDESDALPPASAIRAHYAQRLRDPATYLRALRGGVSFDKLFRGLRKSAAPQAPPANPIADEMTAALGNTPRTILLAARDNTAARFLEAFPESAPGETRLLVDSASHSFARIEDQRWLFEQVRAAIARP
jgi:exosortase A-associated hydrolase 1